MKRLIYFLIIATGIISFIFFIQSCNNEYYDSDQEESAYEIPQKYSVENIKAKNAQIKSLGWKRQLLLGMSNQKQTIGNMGLELKGYSYEGILSKEIILENILNSNSLFPVYNADNSFKLLSINEMISIKGFPSINERINFLKMQIDSVCSSGIEVVKLDWNYMNNEFSTMALVSDKFGGIIYDNIISNIIVTESFETEKEEVNNSIPRLKLGSEESGGSCSATFTKGVNHFDFLYGTLASVIVEGTVSGDKIGDKKSVKSFRGNVTRYAQSTVFKGNWTADGAIEAKDLVLGINGYASLIYAYYIAKDATYTITGGVSVGSFSVSMSAQTGTSWGSHDSGTRYISANELN